MILVLSSPTPRLWYTPSRFVVHPYTFIINVLSVLDSFSPQDMLLGIGMASVVKSIRRRADGFKFPVSVAYLVWYWLEIM